MPASASSSVKLSSKEHILCCIVACIIRDSSNRILLVQEAKESCAGLWYLPAGRVEHGESIYEASCRECLEEAGVVVEPLGVCWIEYNTYQRHVWQRFTIRAKWVSGELKTQPDAESMQAKFFSEAEIRFMAEKGDLRATDFLELIEKETKGPMIGMSSR